MSELCQRCTDKIKGMSGRVKSCALLVHVQPNKPSPAPPPPTTTGWRCNSQDAGKLRGMAFFSLSKNNSCFPPLPPSLPPPPPRLPTHIHLFLLSTTRPILPRQHPDIYCIPPMGQEESDINMTSATILPRNTSAMPRRCSAEVPQYWSGASEDGARKEQLILFPFSSLPVTPLRMPPPAPAPLQ